MALPQRNDPCPCGSGRKYKKCCLGRAAPAARSGTAKLGTDFKSVPTAPPSDAIESLLQQARQFHQAGLLAQAEALYRQVLRLDSRHPEALYRLGLLARDAGRPDIAAELIGQAVRADDSLIEYAAELGLILCRLGRVDEAAPHFLRVLALKPDHVAARLNLGNIQLAQGHLDAAAASYEKGLALDPRLSAAHHNLGTAHFKRGRVEEAVACFRRALALQPEFAEAHSALLYALQYLDDLAPARKLAEHRCYAERFEAPLRPSWRAHANIRDPDRRLRVGYLSPDFHAHSVAYFIEPILAHHDRSQVEVFGYYNHTRQDAVTARLMALMDHWVPCKGWANEPLAARIRQDGIDILVDLAGHTHSTDNRLLAFAHKPAPVQVTYLGYPSTTGLSAIDYRLCSADTDPPGQEAWHSEALYRLPRSLWCYRPLADWPLMPASPPLRHHGAVTFGSMNNLAKVSPATCALWAKILHAVPGSRLFMTSMPEGSARATFQDRFAAHGIDPARVHFFGRLPNPQYWEVLAQIDLALDPFPYNGTTTTCETLWSGIPVVTRAGADSVARSGYALLGMLGLGELIANDADEYVRIAVELANDPERLAALRAGLRPRLAASPLRDEPGLTRDLEAAYRAMWRRWVADGAREAAP
ncbi:MAG: tetratricopeptide repeat protein [Gammaproteobacteria bacterium]|nr:tetratricopeptide repeat protein [Gammaproteobacteria bacterium]